MLIHTTMEHIIMNADSFKIMEESHRKIEIMFYDRSDRKIKLNNFICALEFLRDFSFIHLCPFSVRCFV